MTRFVTVSGKSVDLVYPDWREIDFRDVARGLSQIARFAGQSRRVISVAEHSLVVAELAPPALRLPALLHDAHEAFLSDWPRPALDALAVFSVEARGAVTRLQWRLDVALARAALEGAGRETETGLSDFSRALADDMRSAAVVAADDEALRLEEAVRGEDALVSGISPALSRAAELYPAWTPDAYAVGRVWLDAVHEAARTWGAA